MSEPPVGGTGQPPGDEPPPASSTPPGPPGPPSYGEQPPGTPPSAPSSSDQPPPPPPPPPAPPGPPGGPGGPGGPGDSAGWGSAPPPPPQGGGGYATGPEGYSIGNAFRYAWEKFQANAVPLVLITLVLGLGVVVVQLIGRPLLPSTEIDPTTGRIEGGGMFGATMILTMLISALSIVVQLVVQSGIIKGSLGLTRGQPISFGSAFEGINWGNVVLTAVITAAATFVGLILCVIPGLIVLFLTSYALFFVIDRNMGAIDAIKASIHLTTHNVGTLLLFFLASLVVQIIGACLCGVGLLVAIPLVVIAQAYTFRTLTGDPVTA